MVLIHELTVITNSYHIEIWKCRWKSFHKSKSPTFHKKKKRFLGQNQSQHSTKNDMSSKITTKRKREAKQRKKKASIRTEFNEIHFVSADRFPGILTWSLFSNRVESRTMTIRDTEIHSNSARSGERGRRRQDSIDPRKVARNMKKERFCEWERTEIWVKIE